MSCGEAAGFVGNMRARQGFVVRISIEKAATPAIVKNNGL